MEQARCEVCEKHRPEAVTRPGRVVSEVAFEERLVWLCRAHERIAHTNEARTLEQLRALYGEPTGRRSYIARRRSSSVTFGLGARGPGRRVDDPLTTRG